MSLADLLKTQPALEDLDTGKLKKLAEELRPGHTCWIQNWTPETLKDLWMAQGSEHNMHLDIIFDDNVVWMVRLADYAMAARSPADIRRRVRHSEALTHVILAEAGIPVPIVHHWGQGVLSKTNDSRCTHMIFTRLPGRDGSIDDEPMTPGVRARMIEAYADIAIKISDVKYPAVGGLDIGPDQSIVVGPSVQYIYAGPSSSSPYGGPFRSMGEFHLFYVNNALDLIAQGVVQRQHSLYAYLVYLEWRRLILGHEQLWKEPGEFFLNHPDTHAGNLLLDRGEITGYIDWEWTCTASKEATFAAPRWISDTDAYMEGNNALGDEELMLCAAYEKRGRLDLAECVRNGRVHQRIRDNLANNQLMDPDDPDSLDVLNAIANAFLGSDTGAVPKTIGEWMTQAMNRHVADPRLAQVIALDAHLKRVRQPATQGCMDDDLSVSLLTDE